LESKIANNDDIQFDMSKLELEFDYETDLELIESGRRVLDTDLYHAVEFYVIEELGILTQNYFSLLLKNTQS
jgi:hypothetical protein